MSSAFGHFAEFCLQPVGVAEGVFEYSVDEMIQFK